MSFRWPLSLYVVRIRKRPKGPRPSNDFRRHMKLLLTSSGISNPSIEDALVGLLGKPIADSSALIIPTAIYPFPDGAGGAWRAICGKAPSPLCAVGWKSLGVLELNELHN